ncbi:hypothetical protein PH7735_00005 [Shimia thalassica]|uniref:Uncharacterized protein n=1 Tax=Shimia thalassica TaxID=1715693 RepID=A0A0N7M800_9RHOB|nr:hypothetical protein PH7735_00005 [Shimia thalassica]
MTDTSRQKATATDDRHSASLKALVRVLARASARQVVSDMEQKQGGARDVDPPHSKSEDQK